MPTKGVLKVVAADITTQTRAIFPEDAPAYWKPEVKVNPARFVRASMSIPFFFLPCEVQKDEIPDAGKQASPPYWNIYNGIIPDKVRTTSDACTPSWFILKELNVLHREP